MISKIIVLLATFSVIAARSQNSMAFTRLLNGQGKCSSAETSCGSACCPYANAMCCADNTHCCPSGYLCNFQTTDGSCVQQGSGGSRYWLANVKRQGQATFGGNPSQYQIYRNVKDFGAKGDGHTDDTRAINDAIASGDRCGHGCDSSTLTPAIVYFPPGVYIVSTPIQVDYYTQLIGDALSVPTLKATADFSGMAVIDADPYDNTGNDWFTNQNNFFRQIRNFYIDLTGMPYTSGTGIHWQVAQATSLQNIVFNMRTDGGGANRQQGIFMDNGSGGFMTDLTFNGGHYGAFLGNQQFTSRNLVCNNVQTCMYMNWNWIWTFKSLSVNNCQVGVDMSAKDPANQQVGSIVILDSTFTNTPIGVKTTHTPSGSPTTGGTLVIDNSKFTNCPTAVVGASGTLLAGNTVVRSWAQGRIYSTSNAGGSNIQQTLDNPPTKPPTLLNSQGNIFERSRPQYEGVAAGNFVSVKDNGAKGDGVTDDSAAIQAVLNKCAGTNNIVYFDHGAYLVTRTINIPVNIKITGEIWPILMAGGNAFSDAAHPVPVFKVGNPGDQGTVEISDMIFETKGPQPGAVMVEWNVHDPNGQQGVSGMWDVHWRVGGTAGTQLQSAQCVKRPGSTPPAAPTCEATFLLLHVMPTASIYLENTWAWVSDHEMDASDHNQVSIYNGRGMLIESANGPVWMYGTASEHSQLYQYQLHNTQNVFMGHIQTETPYYQSNPNALSPFKPDSAWTDPTFSTCSNQVSCPKAWGLRIVDSSNILIYGAGLYSFFENYEQTCIHPENCQDHMVSIEGRASSVYLYALSTIAAVNMVTVNNQGVVPQNSNTDTFCSTIALFNT